MNELKNLDKRRKHLSLQSEHLPIQLSTVQKEVFKHKHNPEASLITCSHFQRYLIEQRSLGARNKIQDMSQTHKAQTNWKFVETLLREVKAKVRT